jgi:hypothetical protein
MALNSPVLQGQFFLLFPFFKTKPTAPSKNKSPVGKTLTGLKVSTV